MIFVNFKTYGQGDRGKVLDLVKIIEEVSSSSGIPITPVVQIIDAVENVWVQHLSSSPDELLKFGTKGTFLNHSDHKYESWEELVEAVKNCKVSNLKTMIFADNLEELGKFLGLKPDFIAYEPPELIGSTETSVSVAKPEVIGEAANLANGAQIPLIVGAGVKSTEDIIKSLELGAVGVAVSSAIIKAQDPKKVLLELTKGFIA